MKPVNCLYLAVTPDKYELPIYVTDTPGKMAQLTGISRATINECISKNSSGKRNKMKFVRVRFGAKS